MSKASLYLLLLLPGVALAPSTGMAQSSAEESANKGKPAEEIVSRTRTAEVSAAPAIMDGAMTGEKALASSLRHSARSKPWFNPPPIVKRKESAPQPADVDLSEQAAGQQAQQPAGQPAQQAGGSTPAQAGQDGEALRKAALNPVASLISVPIQENWNFDIGPNNRVQNVLNIQPVIPVSVSENWNLITRVIIPVIWQPIPSTKDEGYYGLGDMNPTFFLSPKKGKVIWGVGPSFVLPTATKTSYLGSGKFSMGPSVVMLVQPGKWTFGYLASNVWSVAGHADRADVNQMVFQYFINYNLKKGWYLTWQPTLTANWEAPAGERWVAPVGGGFGRIMKMGFQPVNVGMQFYGNVKHPTGASSWSLRMQIALLFPKAPKG